MNTACRLCCRNEPWEITTGLYEEGKKRGWQCSSHKTSHPHFHATRTVMLDTHLGGAGRMVWQLQCCCCWLRICSCRKSCCCWRSFAQDESIWGGRSLSAFWSGGMYWWYFNFFTCTQETNKLRQDSSLFCRTFILLCLGLQKLKLSKSTLAI